MVQPIPAPSLRELARPTGVTEGVSSDGCSTPMNYEPAHTGSETFERLRSSGYTPSVSHSLDSSLREGAGKRSHSSGYSLKSQVTGDFHRPYEGLCHSPGYSISFSNGLAVAAVQDVGTNNLSYRRNKQSKTLFCTIILH